MDLSQHPHKIQKLEMIYTFRYTCENCNSLYVEVNKGLDVKIDGECPQNTMHKSIDTGEAGINSTTTKNIDIERHFSADDPNIE